MRGRTAGSTSECEGRYRGGCDQWDCGTRSLQGVQDVRACVVGRLGIVKGIELCVNERTVRRISIPESQGDEPGRGRIDHRVEERVLFRAGQMSFGDSSTTRGT